MKVSAGNNGDFQQPEPGTYLARCIRITDIGTQSGEYQGKATSRRQLILGWELPEELIPTGERQGEPFMVSKFYTMSLNEKATLRHDLVAWRGKEFTANELEGFEMKNVLGAACMVTVTLNDSGRTKVASVAGVPKSMKAKMPAQVNPSVCFSLELDEFDQATYGGLSDGIKRMVDASPEMATIRRGGGSKTVKDDFGDVDFREEENAMQGYDGDDELGF